MAIPSVIIAGAPKAGTTSVFEWLSDHPEVCVSSTKETRYFLDECHPLYNAGSNWRITGIKGYEAFFAHCGKEKPKAVLEATPAYINQETALEFIPGLSPRPRVVFILRKPSERIYSMYQYARNDIGVLPPDMTFKEFLALDAPAHRRSPEGLVLHLAIEQSRYAHYISRWIDRCGPEFVHVFLFDAMKKDVAAFMQALSMKIGITGGFWETYSFDRKNEGRAIKSHGVHRALKKAASALPTALKPDLVKRLYFSVNAAGASGKSGEDRDALAALDRRFAPEVEALARLIKADLSAWK